MFCLQSFNIKSSYFFRQTKPIILINEDYKYKRLTDCIPLLVDEQTGIIRSISELPRQAYSPPFIYYKASVSNTVIFNGNDNMGVTAGTSLNRSKAIVKALGEGIERYCAGSYGHDQFIFTSYSEIEQNAIHPNSWQLYLNDQFSSDRFPLEKFTPDSKVFWAKSKETLSGKTIYLPACRVFCPFITPFNDSNITESMSTGLATHCSYEEASINAFLEIIERNNFMFTWLLRLTHHSLEKASLTREHKNIINLYERYGYDVHLTYNAGKDGIPSFIALVKGTRPYNVPLLIAAATHLDPAQAITKCLDEIALMERLCQLKLLAPSSLATRAIYSEVNTLLDHIMIWLNPKIWHHADFLISQEKTISLTEIPNLLQSTRKEDLKFIVNSIEQLGYPTMVTDITPSDLVILGIHCVRAHVPAYLPLNKSYHCRPLGAQYLKDYFEEKGIKEENLVAHLNPVPHPFA